jgi:hypothetical protein
MPAHPSGTRHAPPLASWLAIILAIAWSAPAHSAPTLGFVENWSGTTLSSWGGGSTYMNPGTGGYNGVGDGFLRVSTAAPANFGVKSNGSEYAGNWTAAGITQVRVWLSDLATDDPAEIHFSLGRDTFDPSPNTWQYNVGLIPPVNGWAEYVVDLTAANWTRIIGAGTFADAAQNVTTVLFRHDVAPFTMAPDPLQGDVGIDHLLLTNGLVGVERPPGNVGTAVRLSAPVPNPSRGAVAFLLESFDTGPVQLRVLDATGRTVRSVELAAGASGPRTWAWDGRDQRGRAAAPGYYRVQAYGRFGGTSQGFVRIR